MHAYTLLVLQSFTNSQIWYEISAYVINQSVSFADDEMFECQPWDIPNDGYDSDT